MRIQKGEPITARFLNWMARICTRMQNIQGYGGIEVKNLASGIYIGQKISPPGSSPVCLVNVNGTTATAGNASGGALGIGYYSCTQMVVNNPNGPIDPTQLLNENQVGTVGPASGPAVNGYGQNLYETTLGPTAGASRTLVTSGAADPVIFLAYLVGTSTPATGALPVWTLIAPIQGILICSTGADTTSGGSGGD